MRIFVGKMFKRWAGSEAISDEDLCAAAKEAFAGNVEGDLGGYLFKCLIQNGMNDFIILRAASSAVGCER